MSVLVLQVVTAIWMVIAILGDDQIAALIAITFSVQTVAFAVLEVGARIK